MLVRPLLCSLIFALVSVKSSARDSVGEHWKSRENIILKCCPNNQIYLVEINEASNENYTCAESSKLINKFSVNNPNNYSNIKIYSKDIKHEIVKTDKSVHSFKFEYVPNFINSSAQNLGVLVDFPYKTYFLEDGKFVFRRPNYWKQWVVYEPRQFCIEHEVVIYEGELESTTPEVVVWVQLSDKAPSNSRAVLSSYGLLVSCVSLALVLAVYALLPDLRNLAGLILMACMATYFAFFLTRVVHVFGNDAKILSLTACSVITIIFYYLMLSTFCWMNVMSFDIWWTFRGIRKASQTRRRGAMSKFRRYCAYAWGLPVLPTLFVVIVDHQDLTHLPDFIKPHIFDSVCYFEKETQLLYVSLPVLILICINILLFLLTAYNIWEVNRNVTLNKDSATNKSNESHSDPSGGALPLSILTPAVLADRVDNAELSIFYLFWVYLRLSLVMGVSWILEVIGNSVHPESPAWIISDLYNALVGLFIFLLFVCKKKIILQLCKRFSIDNRLVRWLRAQDSRAADAHPKSSASQHTEASEIESCAAYKEIS